MLVRILPYPAVTRPSLTYLSLSLSLSLCLSLSFSLSQLGKGLGCEIDGHDMVMRFNFAPTCGYEKDVGSRTTVRSVGVTLLNDKYVDEWLVAPTLLVPTSNSNNFARGRFMHGIEIIRLQEEGSCPHTEGKQVHFLSDELRLWAIAELAPAKPSSGLLGVLAATAACEKVRARGPSLSYVCAATDDSPSPSPPPPLSALR